MSEINTGGPAFPGVEYKASTGGGNHIMTIVGGMTLRDYFAAKAMQGELACQCVGETWLEIGKLAEHCYNVADAMLKARQA